MLNIEKEILLDALSWIIRAVPLRPNIQALEGIVIKTNSDNTITLSAYNNELYMENTVPTKKSDNEEIIIVPGRLLFEMVKTIPGSEIEIKKDEKLNKFVISSKKTKFTVSSISPDEYPQVLTKGETIGNIEAEDLFAAISKTYNASNHDETVPVLASVKLSFSDNKIQYDSTDRFRLAKAVGVWENSKNCKEEVLVGSRAINELSKAFKDKGKLEIYLKKGNNDKNTTIAFSTTNRLIILPLLNVEKFPPTDTLFTDKYKTTVTVNSKQLLECLSRANIVSTRNRVMLEYSDNEIKINAGDDKDIASTSETIPASIVGEPQKVIYNITYLQDGITPINSDNINIKMNEPRRPNEIVAIDQKRKEIENYRYLIVPISS
ncbi:MAG: DNA polymerase III subunit beta [Bifidobacteriaceae bacterium]|jgi:DNA polymerase-3 subunit beta|nr:DNA polymerase III subunit beta [Bifidobacteriaceae bacterium]